MMRDKRLRLLTLGQLALVDHTGRADESLATRPRKLALLAVLALAQRPLTRDALVGMFWGEQDEARARHSLSDALSHLRRALGADAIVATGATVSLATDAPLDIDAVELARAAAEGDHARVTLLYRGSFLESVYVTGSESFEHGVTRERYRLEQLFLRSAAAHCETLRRMDRWDECASLAMRWLDAVPTSTEAALFLLSALDGPGTREGALRAIAEYERLSRRLAADYVLAPEPPVVELAESIRQRAGETAETRAVSRPLTPLPLPATDKVVRLPERHYLTRPSIRISAAAMVLLAAAFVGIRMRGDAAARTKDQSAKPVVAFIPFLVSPRDTGITWLGEGLPHMIANALARATTLELVTPSRVREVRQRAGTAYVGKRSAMELASLGRTAGASLVIHGRLDRRDSLFQLDLEIHDLTFGRARRLHTLSGANIFALADEAAARVLAAVDAQGSGPRIADLETSSVEAYQQYVRAMALLDIGRDADALSAVNAAIERDSGFVSALYLRLRMPADSALRGRLRSALKRHESRATEWERLELQYWDATARGERARTEAVARLLLTRFPRDPRAYRLLAGNLENRGQWREADSVMRAVLALDSVGMEAGRGPCAPCVGYFTLVNLRAAHGDTAGALRAARRWVALQPDLPRTWMTLGWALAYNNRIEEALAAMRRAAALEEPESMTRAYVGRILILGRRYAEAESAIVTLRLSPVPWLVTSSLDLRAILERERGQFRRAAVTTDTLVMRLAAEDPPSHFSAQLMTLHAIGRLGNTSRAIRHFEDFDHGPTRSPVSLAYDAASGTVRPRSFAWHHALQADAIATLADTAYLRVLADSVEEIGGQSGFGRDWLLHHHIRGLIAARAGRHAEAVREFAAARWQAGGWTRTNVEMARSLVALGRTGEAVDVLRQAYITQLDGMARYVPRSEIDYWMARAFASAGARDSASLYWGHVRRAWKDADPEVLRQYQLPN